MLRRLLTEILPLALVISATAGAIDSGTTFQVTVAEPNGPLPTDSSGVPQARAKSQVEAVITGPEGESVALYLYKTSDCSGSFKPYGVFTMGTNGATGPLTSSLSAGSYAFGTGNAVTFTFGVNVPLVNGTPLGTSKGDLGPTATYTDKATGNSVVMTAYPFPGQPNPNLWAHRSAMPNETGMGLSNDPTGAEELYVDSGFIELDVSSLPTSTGLSFQMGSSTGGEAWTVYGSNTKGVLGTTVVASANDQLISHSLPGGFNYYDFVSDGVCQPGAPSDCGGVLVGLINITPTALCQPFQVNPESSEIVNPGMGCDATGGAESSPYAVMMLLILSAGMLIRSAKSSKKRT